MDISWLQSRWDQILCVTPASIYKLLCGFLWHRHNILNSVFSDEVLGCSQAHQRLLIFRRYSWSFAISIGVFKFLFWKIRNMNNQDLLFLLSQPLD